MEDNSEHLRISEFSLGRFIICMASALAIGVIVNQFFPSEEKPPFRIVDLLSLALYYIPFCLFFGAVTLVWDRVFGAKILGSAILVVVSIAALAIGFYAFPVPQYHGVHFLLICFLGFFFSSTEQLVRKLHLR